MADYATWYPPSDPRHDRQRTPVHVAGGETGFFGYKPNPAPRGHVILCGQHTPDPHYTYGDRRLYPGDRILLSDFPLRVIVREQAGEAI